MTGPAVSHTPVGSHPDAVFFRVYLTHAAIAAAAGTVAGMFGTLGFRAQKGQVLDAAIPALLTVQEDFFGRIFEKCQKLFSRGGVNDPLANFFHGPGMF